MPNLPHVFVVMEDMISPQTLCHFKPKTFKTLFVVWLWISISASCKMLHPYSWLFVDMVNVWKVQRPKDRQGQKEWQHLLSAGVWKTAPNEGERLGISEANAARLHSGIIVSPCRLLLLLHMDSWNKSLYIGNNIWLFNVFSDVVYYSYTTHTALLLDPGLSVEMTGSGVAAGWTDG